MTAERQAFAGGWLRLRALDASFDPGALRAVLGEPRSFVRSIEVGGQRLFLKGGPLRGHARRRHALRRLVLRRELPRVRELENLAWLRARFFRAPEPVAAGWVERFGSARFQFLATRAVEAAHPLDEAWPALPAKDRSELLCELGREVARLHALHFVHRDLFLRNLLVAPAETGRRLVFLDAWRGGPGLGLRGPAYDLAALFLDGATVFARDEAELLVDIYQRERERQGRPVPAARFWRAVERQRAALHRVVLRDPARARGRTIAPSWTSPGAGRGAS